VGAVPLATEVATLARLARIELEVAGPGPETHPSLAGLGLTDREAEVLRLVAGGWSNQQIADALFIARKTASVHVSNILGKLGVDSRVEAAAIAHRLGFGAGAPSPPDAA
jgi:DNA-binding NarL/FixJ family response regulator